VTTARSSQVSLESTCFYHCSVRCVRRSFLCGADKLTGRNFDHRKIWILERLSLLRSVFGIEICAYAVMSNHLHLVLCVNQNYVETLTDLEIREQVTRIFSKVFRNFENWDEKRKSAVMKEWRKRLSDLSWFMRCLDEHIARRANLEDNCTGHFWEGRFKSQALLDEGALLTCMAYVDLNPIRAGINDGLEDSDWTSIKQRLLAMQANGKIQNKEITVSPTNKSSNEARDEATASNKNVSFSDSIHPTLAHFMSSEKTSDAGDSRHTEIPMQFMEYVKLVEWTGKQIRSDKKGAITKPPFRLIESLGLNADTWLQSVNAFGQYAILVGSPSRLDSEVCHFRRRWARGRTIARKMYRCAA